VMAGELMMFLRRNLSDRWVSRSSVVPKEKMTVCDINDDSNAAVNCN